MGYIPGLRQLNFHSSNKEVLKYHFRQCVACSPYSETDNVVRCVAALQGGNYCCIIYQEYSNVVGIVTNITILPF